MDQRCRKGSIVSNPQEPYQPGRPDGGPRQPPAPDHLPTGQPTHGMQPGGGQQQSAPGYPAPGYRAPQDGTPPYGTPPSNQQGGYPGQSGTPGPYAGAGAFGLPGQPPAPKRRKLWLILGIVGGVVLLAVIGIIVLFNVVNGATNQARGLADSFTKLVIAGESSKAYDDYLDPALQEQVSKEDFIAGVRTLEMDGTCTPSYNDVQVASENGRNSADIAGVISCDGKEVDLAYRFEGTGELKMTEIKLRPKA